MQESPEAQAEQVPRAPSQWSSTVFRVSVQWDLPFLWRIDYTKSRRDIKYDLPMKVSSEYSEYPILDII